MREKLSDTEEIRLSPFGFAQPRQKRFQRLGKRLVDLVIAATVLALFSPLILVIALLIKLDSPGPAFFKQRRVGQRGQEFTVIKFRTMYVDADEKVHREALAKLVEGKPVKNIEGKGFFKPPDDPRVTSIGRFLRASGLDELPQVVNILRGEMSVVGPRPAIPYELQFFADSHYERLAVRPGVTGLWQVKRHSACNFDEAMNLDVQYVRDFSLWLDIRIILWSIPMILFRKWTF